MTLDVQLQRMTAEEFDAWALLPENVDHNYEFIAGEIVQVVSNIYATEVTAYLTTYIGVYLIQNPIGRFTSAEGGYMVFGERCIPDVAFISNARQPERSEATGYNPIPPDLAVEVISNPDNAEEMRTLRRKITAYLAADTTVWAVDYKVKTIEVHAPGKAAKIYGENDTLDGGEILPGFTLEVKNVFPK